MTPTSLFLIGVAVTAALTIAVVLYLRPYLHEVLVDLCGTPARAAFWTAFATVTVALSRAQRLLRNLATALNLLAASWWLWTAVRVTAMVGPAALASSGAVVWAAFMAPPIISLVALAGTSVGKSRP